MCAKSRRSDYTILVTMGVLAVVIVLLLAVRKQFRRGDADQPPMRTTYSSDADGAIVFYELMGRLGLAVTRSETPLLKDALADLDVLLVVDPILAIHDGEQSALRAWVRRGGVLVTTATSSAGFESLHHMGGPGCGGGPPRCGGDPPRCAPTRSGTWEFEAPTGVSGESAELPLARDVATVHLLTHRTLTPSDPDPSRGLGGVDRLMGDDTGLRVASRRVEQGQVIVLADASFLTNRLIGQVDNAVLAANLFAYARTVARGRRAAVDEYHFGYGTHETSWSVLAGLLVTTGPGWAILSVTLAGVLYLVYRGRRFGTRRSPGRARRRSKIEYVQAVGATYRTAGAHRLALDLLYHGFRRRAGLLVGQPASGSARALAVALARRMRTTPEHYENALVACRQALARPALSRRAFAAAIAQLAEVEGEIFHGRATGK